ncbi:hypothetical protein ACFSUD_10425 [Sulfitobacter aestuarii]|uniref:Uncharacterized protein n=1 Tax=Sulfitobacter aestuarii TaxID=2161676 RepID=A0ABW5U303_9RHOB
MTTLSQPRFWSRPRLLALGGTALLLLVFFGANAHLIAVSFASKPDCVLQSPTEGAAALRAAKPSC